MRISIKYISKWMRAVTMMAVVALLFGVTSAVWGQDWNVKGGSGAENPGGTGGVEDCTGAPTGVACTPNAPGQTYDGTGADAVIGDDVDITGNIEFSGGAGGVQTGGAETAGKGGDSSVTGDGKNIETVGAITIQSGVGGAGDATNTDYNGGDGGNVVVNLGTDGTINASGNITIQGNDGGVNGANSVGGKGGSMTVTAHSLESGGAISIFSGRGSGNDTTVTLTGGITAVGDITINAGHEAGSASDVYNFSDGKLKITATEIISSGGDISILTNNVVNAYNRGDLDLIGVANVIANAGAVNIHAGNGSGAYANNDAGNIVADQIERIEALESVNLQAGNSDANGSLGGDLSLASLTTIVTHAVTNSLFEVTIKGGSSNNDGGGAIEIPNLKEIITDNGSGAFGDLLIQTGSMTTDSSPANSLDLSSLERVQVGAIHLCAGDDCITPSAGNLASGTLTLINSQLVIESNGSDTDTGLGLNKSYFTAGRDNPNTAVTEGELIVHVKGIVSEASGLTVSAGYGATNGNSGSKAELIAEYLIFNDASGNGFFTLHGGDDAIDGSLNQVAGGAASVEADYLTIQSNSGSGLVVSGGDNSNSAGGEANIKVNKALTLTGDLSISGSVANNQAQVNVSVEDYYAVGVNTWNVAVTDAEDFQVKNLIIDGSVDSTSKVEITNLKADQIGDVIILPSVIIKDGGAFDGSGANLGDTFTFGDLTVIGSGNTLSNLTIDYNDAVTSPQSITFDLTGVSAADTLLDISGTSIDFANKTLQSAGVRIVNPLDSGLKPGDEIDLFSAAVSNLAPGDFTAQDGLEAAVFSVLSGTEVKLSFQGQSDHNAYKPYFEGAASSVLALSEAAVGLDNTIHNLAASLRSGQTQIKVGFQGERVTNKTGSKVKLKLWGLSLAGGRKSETSLGYLSYGLFLEGGWGDYNTFNSLSIIGDVKGDGDTRYFGGGLFVRHDFSQGTWLSLSARAGVVDNDYQIDQLVSDGIKYSSSAGYYGINFGVGHDFTVSDATSLDLYGKFFWTHVDGDTINDQRGGTVSFDSTNSVRTRIGGRITQTFSEKVEGYFGLAWEHEFAGKTGGHYVTASGRVLKSDSPDLGGSSAYAELGLTIQATDNVAFELTGFGLAGQSKGGGATASLVLTF
ncbi:MAG: hypothetical protein LBR53_06780 [Deltaproteobacteria bacterium]|nr:hypothetical protein [Deltaproteobacteria bacterium]